MISILVKMDTFWQNIKWVMLTFLSMCGVCLMTVLSSLLAASNILAFPYLSRLNPWCHPRSSHQTQCSVPTWGGSPLGDNGLVNSQVFLSWCVLNNHLATFPYGNTEIHLHSIHWFMIDYDLGLWQTQLLPTKDGQQLSACVNSPYIFSDSCDFWHHKNNIQQW